MKGLKTVVLATGLAACQAAPANQAMPLPDPNADQAIAAAPVMLKAADGVTVHGDYYDSPGAKALILLFHQADSGKGEYAAIGPRLVGMGYSALAIDQRTGGKLFGENRTMKDAGLTDPDAFLAAMPDLQAALDWAGARKLPVIVWGSSYSASLVFPLAVRNPGKIAAILAFSPGEYFPDKALIRTAAAKVTVPVFITQAKTAEELADSKPVFDALPGSNKTLFEAKTAGIHGSMTLSANLNKTGAEENWQAVKRFLDGLALK